MEGARDILRQPLDDAFVLLAQIFVAEAWEEMFLVELVELGGVLGDFGEELGDFFLDVYPARWEEVHFDDHVAIFVVDEAPAFFRLGGFGGAIGELWLFGWVVD